MIFSYYYSENEVPYGSVVYTDHEYFVYELRNRNDLIVVYDPDKICRKLEEAILTTMLINEYRGVTIGIDTGSILSYVILGDEDLLLYGDGNLRELREDLEYVINCIPFLDIRIKVGLGPRSGEVIEYVKKKFTRIPIELVDEASTSPKRSRLDDVIYSRRKLRGLKPFRHKDIYAAYRIALSKGVEVI